MRSLKHSVTTSCGIPGTIRGELKGPRDIAIDQDGFVFVCDTGNNRVQVF